MKEKVAVLIIMSFVFFSMAYDVVAQKYLPFEGGSIWECTQGNDYPTSHNGKLKYAYDFAPRNGNLTDVVAMESGEIVAIVKNVCCSTYPDKLDFGNYITIKNSNGVYDHYTHLKYGGLIVNLGDKVAQGQKIAEVGTTGYSTGVHIHVHQTDEQSIFSQSIYFVFNDADVQKHNGKPVLGTSYTSDNYSVVKFSDSSTVYLFSNGKLWPILSQQAYSLLGYRCGCTMTPDWSYVAKLSSSEKSNYTIRNEVIPSENNAATGRMIAYRVVPKVGPTSCMCIAVDSTRIYLFQNGKFWHIANYEVYKSLGYKDDFSDVVIITPDWRRRRFI